MASTVVAVASGTADAQAFTGACSLVGYTVVGSGTAPAFKLHDGDADTDPMVVTDAIATGTGKSVLLPSVPFKDGIFVERTSGTTELVLYFA